MKVSEDVYELVKTFVFETSGTFHKGSIKETLEKAARHYVRMEIQRLQNPHTHAHSIFDITSEESKVPRKILKQRDRIVKFLQDQHYGFEADLLKRLNPQQTAETCVYVGQAQLDAAISYVVGGDKRTLNKTMKTLKCYHLIRKVGIDKFGIDKFEFSPFIDTSSNRTYSNPGSDDYVVDVEGIQRRQREREEKAKQEQNPVLYTSPLSSIQPDGNGRT